MPPELSNDDLNALAQRLTDPVADNVAAQLDSGWYGDQLVLSRRQVLALGTMGLGASGLMALGVDRASAQSAAGQVGTESEPVDVEAASVDAQSVSTNDIDIDNISLGTIKEMYETAIDDNHDYAKAVEFTDGVSTTATTVLSPSSVLASGFTAFEATVIGREPDTPHLFIDSLVALVGGPITRVGSAGSGSEDTRSYSISGAELQLAMSADTYNVIVIADIARVV